MNQNRAARMGGTLRAAFGMRREMVSDPICFRASFVRGWDGLPGVSIPLKSPMAEIRTNNDELLGNTGNRIGLKSCLTPFHLVNGSTFGRRRWPNQTDCLRARPMFIWMRSTG